MAAVVFASGFLLMQKGQGGVKISDLLKQLQIDPSQLLPVSGQPESGTEETVIQSRPVVVEEIPGNVYPTEGSQPVAEPSGGEAAGDPGETQPPEPPAAADGTAGEAPPAETAAGDPAAGDPGAAGSGEGAADGTAATDPPAPAESTAAPETPPAETQAPPPAETAASAGVTYIVEAGDSLYSISRKFYGTEAMVAKIQELNGLSNADLIKEGQSILLP